MGTDRISLPVERIYKTVTKNRQENRKVGLFMIPKRLSRILVIGFLALSVTFASSGGILSATALAATPTATDSSQSTGVRADKAIGGLLALGLLAVIASGHHGKSDSSTPPQTSSGGIVPAPKPIPTPSASGLTADEQQAFRLLNADRVANGLPALRNDSRLNSVAEAYAKDMIKRGFFAHNNPEGQTPFDRMRAAGISYVYAGENIAINQSPSAAETAFMSSPGHRANILNSHYTDVGLGVGYSTNGSVYVDQEFISR
jgi:uncharacterized protein YkwD